MLIAEIGINHNGDLKLAKRMILKAFLSGADIVKFQKRTPTICVPEEQKNKLKDTPWGSMTYLEYKERIEFSKEDYLEIDKYCKELGIPWTVSVWDKQSVDFIEEFDVPWIKIPSPMITDIDLLMYIKEKGFKTIMSTGMSNRDEIEMAASILEPIAILSCTSSYPTPIEDINLNKIHTLKILFHNKNYKIGYSGHEDGILPTLMAITMGAKIVERHFTIDKTLWGSDQSSSLEPKEFKEIKKFMNEHKIYKGRSVLAPAESELEKISSLRKI